MKEAASEANLTVIAIVLIGVVAAVVTPLISGLLKGQANKSCCQSLGGKWTGSACVDYNSGNSIDIKDCVAGQNTDNTGNK